MTEQQGKQEQTAQKERQNTATRRAASDSAKNKPKPSRSILCKAMGIGAAAMGVLAVVFSFIPNLVLLALVLAVAGLILGVVSLLLSFGDKAAQIFGFAGTALCAIALIIAVVMYASATGDGTTESFFPDGSTEGEQASTESYDFAVQAAEGYESYEAIYNDYAQKLTDATPGLIEEFESEAALNFGGEEGLTEILSSKQLVLSEIAAECANVLSAFYSASSQDDAEATAYIEWNNKINSMYTQEARKLTEIYDSMIAE